MCTVHATTDPTRSCWITSDGESYSLKQKKKKVVFSCRGGAPCIRVTSVVWRAVATGIYNVFVCCSSFSVLNWKVITSHKPKRV